MFLHKPLKPCHSTYVAPTNSNELESEKKVSSLKSNEQELLFIVQKMAPVPPKATCRTQYLLLKFSRHIDSHLYIRSMQGAVCYMLLHILRHCNLCCPRDQVTIQELEIWATYR